MPSTPPASDGDSLDDRQVRGLSRSPGSRTTFCTAIDFLALVRVSISSFIPGPVRFGDDIKSGECFGGCGPFLQKRTDINSKINIKRVICLRTIAHVELSLGQVHNTYAPVNTTSLKALGLIAAP